MQSQCCHHVNICFFISFLFAKLLLQMTYAFNYLSVSFEVFLVHEITWTKYQKVFTVNVISWNKKVLSHRWTLNNMRWGCFHCEITWYKKLSSNISSPYFMLRINLIKTLIKANFEFSPPFSAARQFSFELHLLIYFILSVTSSNKCSELNWILLFLSKRKALYKNNFLEYAYQIKI